MGEGGLQEECFFLRLSFFHEEFYGSPQPHARTEVARKRRKNASSYFILWSDIDNITGSFGMHPRSARNGVRARRVSERNRARLFLSVSAKTFFLACRCCCCFFSLFLCQSITETVKVCARSTASGNSIPPSRTRTSS